MNKQASNAQSLLGAGLLAAILLFGVGGALVYALEAEQAYQPDERYVDECGACHYAYPPGLLPASSWQAIMGGLDDHFEDNAETDADTIAYVTAYLVENSLRQGDTSKLSVLLRNMPAQPPLRITDLPGFRQAHEPDLELAASLNMGMEFFSPCEDCHRQADRGVFDKDLLSKGYGPAARSQ